MSLKTCKKIYKPVKNRNVFLQEKLDGSVSLADFNYPAGKYNVSILDKDGDVISSNNKIVKNGNIIELFRRFEGSDKMTVAQCYKIPIDNINSKVLEFIIEKCPDVRKIFVDSMPSINSRVLDNKKMIYESKKGKWIPAPTGDNESEVNTVNFQDIIEFSEKYMIVKGFMQVGKTNFIISSAIWFMINGMSSIIVVRNYNGDKDQFVRRVQEYNEMLKKYMGKTRECEESKFVIECIFDKIKSSHFSSKNPKIIVCIANISPLKKLTSIIENNPSISKKYSLMLDEVDYIDSEGTGVTKELDKLRQHCFCSYGVSATILDSTFKRDVEKGNVIILSTPENYKSVVNFKFIHLVYKNLLVTKKDGDAFTDLNLFPYLDEFSKKTPYYVELYDIGESECQSECYHPVISLMRVAITNDSNIRLLFNIAEKYDFPVMYFQGGKGAGHITLIMGRAPEGMGRAPDGFLSERKPIKLKNGSKSTIVNGEYHVFDNSSPAIVLEWLKNTGGGVTRFPRIMIITGCMAARCQSFGASDFNICLSDKKLAWHLTEMYLSVSTVMDQPELLQTAGRLCVVARDNIQPLMYASKDTCIDLIKAFQTQEELLERARNDQQKQCIGKIMESLPMYRKKVISGRSLTKKANYKLNLVSKKADAESGGWNKRDVYCSKDVNGNKISASKLQISENIQELLTELQQNDSVASDITNVVKETSISRLQKSISDYVGTDKNKNTWRSAKEWLHITGLCGFKSADAHHYGILTKLHKRGFLERNESNLTRICNPLGGRAHI
jgi:hypothetical protein